MAVKENLEILGGMKPYLTDQTGVIRYGLTGAATVASSPIQ